jgi:hypothetical protein
MCAVRIADYDGQLCEALEGLQSTNPLLGLTSRPDRLVEIERCCRSYLAKLASMSDLYLSALSPSKLPQ